MLWSIFDSVGRFGTSCCVVSGPTRSTAPKPWFGRLAGEWSSHLQTFKLLVTLKTFWWLVGPLMSRIGQNSASYSRYSSGYPKNVCSGVRLIQFISRDRPNRFSNQILIIHYSVTIQFTDIDNLIKKNDYWNNFLNDYVCKYIG